MADGGTEAKLSRFLEDRLGLWPPTDSLHIVPHVSRETPGWNGEVVPFIGIESPGGTVISVAPSVFPNAPRIDPLAVEDELGAAEAYLSIPRLFGHPERHFGRAVFRWSDAPTDSPDIGEWVSPDDPRLPDWLHPFNGDVLVVWAEDGTYAAGVGRKKHNACGHEIAVGTAPAHRGKGLARHLVAQAARRILDEGALPLYLHGDHNAASGHVADAAGFPHRGWHAIELR